MSPQGRHDKECLFFEKESPQGRHDTFSFLLYRLEHNLFLVISTGAERNGDILTTLDTPIQHQDTNKFN